MATAEPDVPDVHHSARSGDDGRHHERSAIAERIAQVARAGSHRVAVAESLTGGLLASDLARAESASDWFQGGVVSYATQVKHDVLNVRPGPVVSEAAARDMAGGVALLLGATSAVAVTGVGGPDDQEGNPPGTVWVGVCHGGTTSAARHALSGTPEEICASACVVALRALLDCITGTAG